jgi:MoaA/NifB/PqqE/SkfB family radical SAM enzyme
LSNYIRHAKINGFLVKLDTNGLLLDETKVKELKKSGIDRIGVSIDSPYETVHDKLRGVNGIFNKAMEGIKYCRKYGIYCYISVYATKENLKNGELLRVINLAKSLGAKTRILSTICSGKWIDRNDLTLSTEDISLLKSFLENKIVYWEIEDLDEKVNSFFCVALKKELFYVSAYGDVQPCCYLPVSFGNIREEPLEKIVKRMWSSDLILDHKIYYDCPANNLDIAKRYSNLIRPKGQYPIRFEHCLSANNLNKQE